LVNRGNGQSPKSGNPVPKSWKFSSKNTPTRHVQVKKTHELETTTSVVEKTNALSDDRKKAIALLVSNGLASETAQALGNSYEPARIEACLKLAKQYRGGTLNLPGMVVSALKQKWQIPKWCWENRKSEPVSTDENDSKDEKVGNTVLSEEERPEPNHLKKQRFQERERVPETSGAASPQLNSGQTTADTNVPKPQPSTVWPSFSSWADPVLRAKSLAAQHKPETTEIVRDPPAPPEKVKEILAGSIWARRKRKKCGREECESLACLADSLSK